MAPIIVFAIGTVAAWVAWIFVIVRFDPTSAGFVAHILFYASFALALQGTLMLAGIFWRRRQRGMIASKTEMGIIARQALLFNGFLLISLILASRQLLKWWNVIPLAILTLTIELFFISIQKHSHTQSPPVQTAR
ncbi:MAG: hypothetical protein Q7S48_00615 [bacterium]|nr:hypothetical protein [bacterium]